MRRRWIRFSSTQLSQIYSIVIFVSVVCVVVLKNEIVSLLFVVLFIVVVVVVVFVVFSLIKVVRVSFIVIVLKLLGCVVGDGGGGPLLHWPLITFWFVVI